ncbi:MAG: hypothetical protein KA712_12035 [Myxococcales bacterium]|nr:hypothetical protein [Myxococcales bacterium]
MKQFPDPITPSSLSHVSGETALQWMKIKSADVEWPPLIAHLEELGTKTHENNPITRNYIVSPTKKGEHRITASSVVKAFSGLAGSGYTYFQIDNSLRLVDYREVLWSEVKEPEDYKLHPDFLHPFSSQLRHGEFSAHLTTRKDIVVMNDCGLVASKRRTSWHLYDVLTFKNFIADVIDSYRVGCNLFDMVFDLSYRRHGALLIFDPEGAVAKNIANRGSLFSSGVEVDAPREILRHAVNGISLSSASLKARKKRLLLELASVDGAILFDERSVLGFGCIVQSHPSAGSHDGARTTAAHSAFLWGGKPFKISADGDITVLFHSPDKDGTTQHSAETTFL